MAISSLVLKAVPGLPMVVPGDDLAGLLGDAMARAHMVPADGDVLVIAQKIVSKAEGRIVDIATVTASARAVELAGEIGKDPRVVEVILGEAVRVVRARPNLLIVEHKRGWVMANAGVDQSNVGGTGRLLLLPEDPDASAERLRVSLSARFGVELAVVINDSFGRAWRRGTAGIAIGVAGLPSMIDLRGQPDLFGRILEVSIIGFADEIAAAASLLMGQAAEYEIANVVDPNFTVVAKIRKANLPRR